MTTVYLLIAMLITPAGEFKYITTFIKTEAQCKVTLAVRKHQMETFKPYWSHSACVPIEVKFPKNPEKPT